MKIYLAGGLMYFDEIRDLAESPHFKHILFSYFFVTEGKPSHHNHWVNISAKMGMPCNVWFYHPESESYFMSDSRDERAFTQAVDIGIAITGTEQELKQTIKREKKKCHQRSVRKK